MADIFHQQNDPFLLRCQVAQRQEYSSVKRLALWQLIITMIFAVLSIAATALNVEWLTAVACFLAVALVLFNKHADQMAMELKRHAASIQQFIDVTLFAAAIGNNATEWGELPNKTDIAHAASKFGNGDVSKMQNWYSDYSSLSGICQVFYCQNENIRWNYELHKRFKRLQLVSLCVVAVVFLSILFLVNPSFIRLVCVLSWLAPIAEYTYSIWSEVQKSILSLQDLAAFSNKIENELSSIPCQSIIPDLIQLQNKIRRKRESGFLIPDWFYNRHKEGQQRQEDDIAKNLSKMNGPQ